MPAPPDVTDVADEEPEKGATTSALEQLTSEGEASATEVNEKESNVSEKGKGYGTTSFLKQMTTQMTKHVTKQTTTFIEEAARVPLDIGHRPWLNKAGETTWPPLRIWLYKITTAQKFDTCMGAIIIFNMILIIYETDYRAQCYPEYADRIPLCPHNPDNIAWINVSNMILLAVYTFEAALHIYILRRAYVKNRWNLLDFFIVTAGWFTLSFEGAINVSYLRIFRITRLGRAFRIVLSIRELYMLLTGLVSSFKAIFFGALLLWLMLICWGIVLVEFVHPVNSLIDYGDCERCSRGFRSVVDSTLSLFQTIIAGDSWGTINVPVIEAQPLLAIITVAIVLSVSLGIMNLILAVIVESAAEARSKDRDELAKSKKIEQRNTKAELFKICSEIDADFSGTITIEEMRFAFETHREFGKIMTLLEVTPESLDSVFFLMDQDKSGAVEYKEFCEMLYSLTTSDVRMMVAVQKCTFSEFEQYMRQFMGKLGAKVEAQCETLELHSKLLMSMKDNMNQPWGEAEEYAGGSNGVKEQVQCSAAKAEKYAASSKRVKKQKEQGGSDSKVQGEANDKERLFAQEVVQAEAELAWPFEPPRFFEPVDGWMGSELKTLESADWYSELSSLHLRVEELAGLSADIVRKADEQTATMLRHSHFLASIRHTLPQALAGEPDTAWVSSQIGKLQRHVRERLAGLVQDLERKVDEEVGALSSSSQILESLESLVVGSSRSRALHGPEAKANGINGVSSDVRSDAHLAVRTARRGATLRRSLQDI
eukprot:CAMPEP_0204187446 /NCGR_PEP_ID=MMETSP0361-20130328/56807_1 /ASSEMBLY_ACC=CAM_ASM_000343 /TAXON_ID=268821 /ORGANISM="Scrippsiella Hangoei, Strain SHTV-5" /LENGTH=767 /DNA_ID=CAMNT_0051147847 /DNA_START=49 /DNA_END=2350 /DNA_ORIENTATION=+